MKRVSPESVNAPESQPDYITDATYVKWGGKLRGTLLYPSLSRGKVVVLYVCVFAFDNADREALDAVEGTSSDCGL